MRADAAVQAHVGVQIYVLEGAKRAGPRCAFAHFSKKKVFHFEAPTHDESIGVPFAPTLPSANVPKEAEDAAPNIQKNKASVSH